MSLFLLLLGLLAGWVCYQVFIAPKFNPLQQIAGPPYVWKGDVKINEWVNQRVSWSIFVTLQRFKPFVLFQSIRYIRSEIWAINAHLGTDASRFFPLVDTPFRTQFCILGRYPFFDIGSLVCSTYPDKSDDIRKTISNTWSYFEFPRKRSDLSGGTDLQTSTTCYCTYIL